MNKVIRKNDRKPSKYNSAGENLCCSPLRCLRFTRHLYGSTHHRLLLHHLPKVAVARWSDEAGAVISWGSWATVASGFQISPRMDFKRLLHQQQKIWEKKRGYKCAKTIFCFDNSSSVNKTLTSMRLANTTQHEQHSSFITSTIYEACKEEYLRTKLPSTSSEVTATVVRSMLWAIHHSRLINDMIVDEPPHSLQRAFCFPCSQYRENSCW